MTQVVYGQKGYLGSSMSVRAAEAYEQGEMPISRWTKTAIIHAVKDYCFDFDLAYDPDIEKKTKAELAKEFLEYKSWHHSSRTAREVEFFGLNEDAVCRSFEQMSEEQIIERDRQMADERAALEARLQSMQSREKEFEKKFECDPSSVLAYEAIHPEMCERFISRRKNTEMIKYRLPTEAVKAGMKEEQVYLSHTQVKAASPISTYLCREPERNDTGRMSTSRLLLKNSIRLPRRGSVRKCNQRRDSMQKRLASMKR